MMTSNGTEADPWRVCYQQLAPKLLLFARQWVHDAADAEDVVQAAFVRFWRRQPEAQPEHYPLLFAAVRSAALDLLRSNARRVRREDSYGGDASRTPVATFSTRLEQQEQAAAVQAALATLPPEQRETLVLRIWGELTLAEVATAVGVSINTVASRYRYGMEALRKTLKPMSYERI